MATSLAHRRNAQATNAAVFAAVFAAPPAPVAAPSLLRKPATASAPARSRKKRK